MINSGIIQTYCFYFAHYIFEKNTFICIFIYKTVDTQKMQQMGQVPKFSRFLGARAPLEQLYVKVKVKTKKFENS